MARTQLSAEIPEIHIRPSRGWASLGLGEVWRYRELLFFLLSREVKGRYRQMAFGPLWIMIQPLMSMVLFSLIFGRIARLPSDGVPYPIFTYVALLPWQFFSGSLRGSTQSLFTQRTIISKVFFPRLIIPLNSVATSFVDFSFSFIVLVGMMTYYALQGSITISWTVLLFPFFLLQAAVIAMGIGCCFSGTAVKYRDVGLVTGYLLTSWQYLTPVAYAASNIPEQWLSLYKLNPMYSVIENIRWALIGKGTPPDIYTLYTTVVAIALFALGIALFRRAERTIVDVL